MVKAKAIRLLSEILMEGGMIDSLQHPRLDILKLLAEHPRDPYQLNKELGIGYRALYAHMETLERAGLVGSRRLKYCITEKGREIMEEGLQ